MWVGFHFNVAELPYPQNGFCDILFLTSTRRDLFFYISFSVLWSKMFDNIFSIKNGHNFVIGLFSVDSNTMNVGNFFGLFRSMFSGFRDVSFAFHMIAWELCIHRKPFNLLASETHLGECWMGNYLPHLPEIHGTLV